ncbi:MAG TPA: 23S rRNA (adenine(2503)-C(2))-methyltransferase RlmN [Bacteroidales bacterium]|nr:23S rRNA (adenine(2503)-C(2))-methyltransferase RlmN [Bacteroidales bacterium]
MSKQVNRIPLAGMDLTTLERELEERGVESKYGRRILYWIYRRGIRSFDEINDLPKDLLSVLSVNFTTGLSDPVSSSVSSDGSVKYLFETYSGLLHEAVYLPEGKRHTICISVQSGCRMGCRFCATGLNGWKGSLTAGEILNQVIRLPHEVTHVVMMGMGEPGDNIDEVIRACNVLTAEWGLPIGRSRITVSTVGVVPAVKRLLNETDCNITLSLHSPFPDERREVIPSEARWPFRETLELLKNFRARRNRRFTVAYVMIRGINDTEAHLEALKILLSGTGIRVNLLPYHPLEADSYFSSDNETMMKFKHELVTSGTGASVRKSRGTDIAAACGMLAANAVKGKSVKRNIN